MVHSSQFNIHGSFAVECRDSSKPGGNDETEIYKVRGVENPLEMARMREAAYEQVLCGPNGWPKLL
jgi:hypothetical protein